MLTLEGSGAQTLRTDYVMNNIFIDSGFFNKGEEADFFVSKLYG